MPVMPLFAPSRILLIRHATIDGLDRIVGRTTGVTLNAVGVVEAEALAGWSAQAPLSAILCSPQPRALQTALAVARPHHLVPEPRPEFDEVDFGAWTGRAFSELSADPVWQMFNQDRCRAAAPAGESMRGVLERVTDGLAGASQTAAGEPIAIVTHAEIIRCALIAAFDLSLDDWPRFQPAPASISTLAVNRCGVRSLSVDVLDPLCGPDSERDIRSIRCPV